MMILNHSTSQSTITYKKTSLAWRPLHRLHWCTSPYNFSLVPEYLFGFPLYQITPLLKLLPINFSQHRCRLHCSWKNLAFSYPAHVLKLTYLTFQATIMIVQTPWADGMVLANHPIIFSYTTDIYWPCRNSGTWTPVHNCSHQIRSFPGSFQHDLFDIPPKSLFHCWIIPLFLSGEFCWRTYPSSVNSFVRGAWYIH